MLPALPTLRFTWHRLLALGLLLALARPAAAQTTNYFQPVAGVSQRVASPWANQLQQYRAYSLDLAGLQAALAGARQRGGNGANLPLSLPRPDGTSQRFTVWEAPLLAPALAAQYPQVHTYGGRALDDPTAQLTLTVGPGGLFAQVLAGPAATWRLVPGGPADAGHCLAFYTRDVLAASSSRCYNAEAGAAASGSGARSARVGTLPLVVYRLVINTTRQFTASRPAAVVMTDVAAIVNDTRAVLERDLAVSFTLVGTHFYTNTDPGGYAQVSDPQMLFQNCVNTDTQFGPANYDVSHVFSTMGSGLANVACVGDNTLSQGYTRKGGGVSGVGPPFVSTLFAHEMGHQLGANHTFNTGTCSFRNATTAWEPGQGTTFMSYAVTGCSPDALIQPTYDRIYHLGSVNEIRNYLNNAVPTVGTRYDAGNTPPAFGSTPPARTIPWGTPFKLTATATDPDPADVLTYNWEEFDLGSPATLGTLQFAYDNWPLFRSVLPSAEGATRYFPRLAYLLGPVSPFEARTERLPTVARTLTFRCAVRDSHTVPAALPAAPYTSSGVAGAVAQTADVVLTVSDTNPQPFAVTAPGAGAKWLAGSTQTVTWQGVGTKTSAVNCQAVNVRLSTDGGLTYPTVLAAAVPNADGTGTASFVVPALGTRTARVMVEAADNYFFAISPADFGIITGPLTTGLSPARGPVGSLVTLTGTGFGTSAADLQVTFNGAAGTITGAVAGTSLQVQVPPAATTGPVVLVRTGAGAGLDSPGTFTVTPTLTSTSPTVGAEGSLVTVAGTGLTGATRVAFNGAAVRLADFVSTNYTAQPNTITVRVPVGATSGPVTVTTPGGTSPGTVSFTVTTFTFAALAVSPAPGAPAADEAAPVVVTFNAPPSAATPLLVSSLQAGGRRAGTATVQGNTFALAPTQPFRAGEVVQVTVSAAATSAAGGLVARPLVSQYTTRALPPIGRATSATYATGVGSQPDWVVAGNLNADPALDLVVVNTVSSTVSVLLNNGSGTGFTPAPGSPYAVAADPRQAVLADLNNDGILDLLVASASGTVQALRGYGDGSFAAQTTLPGLGPVQSLAVGDLNGDGNLDWVAPVGAVGMPGTAVVALGTGTFAFALSTCTGLSPGPVTAVLADLDEDGKLDLVTAGGVTPASTTGTVSVRLGNGTGTFSGALDLPAEGVSGLVAVDFTGDGHLDLATANVYATTDLLLTWVGQGDGTFGPAVPLPHTAYGYTLSAGDYDGDGRIDLVLPRSEAPAGGVDLYSYNPGPAAPGQPANSFGRPVSVYNIGANPNQVAVADVNNDRILDFITANSVGGNSVSVSLGVATTPLTTAAATPTAGGLALYPNPATSTVTVQLSGQAAPAPVVVLNALGQMVLSRPALAAGQAIQLPLAGLAPGLYVVRCGSLTQRLTVE